VRRLLLGLSSCFFGVGPCPLLTRPDRDVDVGCLRPQRPDVRLLSRCAGERIPAEEIAGVLPRDLVHVAVVGAGGSQLGEDLLRRVGPEAVGMR
jgi:hypothetical protein